MEPIMCSIGHKRKYKKGIAEAFLEYKTEDAFLKSEKCENEGGIFYGNRF